MSAKEIKIQMMSKVEIENAVLFPHLIDLMAQGHTVTLRLRGVSMRPFLEDGRDIALMRAATNPQEGEPVLAEIEPGRWVMHRIIEINGDKVTLLGDGNLTPEYCHVEDIKAQIVGFYRKGRESMDRVDGSKWRAYSWCWSRLRPVRRYLLAIHRRMI